MSIRFVALLLAVVGGTAFAQAIPAGYPVQLRIPYTQLSPTPLYPTVTVPFTGSVL